MAESEGSTRPGVEMDHQQESGLRARVRFAAVPSAYDEHVWGIWDLAGECWAAWPAFPRETSERLAATMVDIHAAGREAIEPTAVRWRGLPFVAVAGPRECAAWGVMRRSDCRLVEPTRYEPLWAERIAAMFNEACAAGLAEAVIGKARLAA
jgi:hypothetical protein